MRRRKIIGLATSRVVEEYAYLLDSMRIPRLRKKQEKFILECFRVSNDIRRKVGVEPKVFKRLKNGNTIEVITV